MWTILVIVCSFLIIALGVFVALYVEKHHEDYALLRVVEQNGMYYIQKHEMECDDYGKYHSVWKYEENSDISSNHRYEFNDYREAAEFAKKLQNMYHMNKNESLKKYFEGKRDDFIIIKYFE